MADRATVAVTHLSFVPGWNMLRVIRDQLAEWDSSGGGPLPRRAGRRQTGWLEDVV
ncbi:hypothetical protein [Micromonospora sp. NBC_00617]|uniref:hypothetical protein n=1 Tax=Micromonospora sp. NBC_00617 TaxID=2903587 RepID=UPI0030DF0704